MLKIEGDKVDRLPEYTWNADLIAFDGPFLSLFKCEDGTDALFAWLDCDVSKHKWAIVNVDRDTLTGYLTRAITLRDVFIAAPHLVVFDSGGKQRRNIIRTTWDELPESYRPSKKSFLTAEIATAEAELLATETTVPYSIKLDGELYIDDLAAIPKLYQQLYSFHYALEHLYREAVRNTVATLVSNWRGGFSAVNLFTGLRSVMPAMHRPRVSRLHYASPGSIEMDLLPAMAEQIRDSARHLESPQAFIYAETLYSDIYKYFRKNGIAGFDSEQSSKEDLLTDEQADDLREFVIRLVDVLGWTSKNSKFAELEIGPLAQLRALLAYYRRLRQLMRLQFRGLIALTDV